MAVFAAIALLLGRQLSSSFVPEEDLGYFFVNVTLPDGASLQRTDAFSAQVEQQLRQTEGVAHVFSVMGFSVLSGTVATNSGTMFVALEPWHERKGAHHTSRAIADRMNKQLAQLPTGSALIVLPPSIPGVGVSGGFTFELQDRSGGTPQYLAEQVERFLDAAKKRPELGQVNSFYRASVPQRFIDVDRDQVLKQGASISEVYQTLQAYLGGAYVNDFSRFGRQWRVYLQAEPEYRADTESLRLFSVRGTDGQIIPLTQLLSVQPTTGPQFTTRFNLYRAAEISGSAAPGYSSGQAMDALEQVAREVLPPTMGYDWSALSYQERHSARGGRTYALALVVVFLVLAALYESWSLPWSVLLTTPVAVVGAFLGLLLRGYPTDVFSQIGMVMLIGLTAKNAILIVEFARSERRQGRSIHDAAVGGAELRLRPILMTSFAFIFGCVPLWLASGSGAISRRELGTVVISGMLVATLIGIFLVPAVFAFVEQLIERRQARKAARAARSAEAPR